MTVRNTGDTAADETVQLYVTDTVSTVATPVTQLMDFRKVRLCPGQSQRVDFRLNYYQLSLLDAEMTRVVEAGTFRVFAGGSSPYCTDGNEYRKSRLGYADDSEGVSGEFTVGHEIRANFEVRMVRGENECTVYAKNTGGICDVLKMKLFAGKSPDETGKRSALDEIAGRRCELEAGEAREFSFPVGAAVHDVRLLCNNKIYMPENEV